MSCFVNTITTFCWLDYIYAEGNIVAVRVYENGAGSLYYVLTDHLGSWEKVLDEAKNTVQQTHFDPWGNRMTYGNWTTPQTQTSVHLRPRLHRPRALRLHARHQRQRPPLRSCDWTILLARPVCADARLHASLQQVQLLHEQPGDVQRPGWGDFWNRSWLLF